MSKEEFKEHLTTLNDNFMLGNYRFERYAETPKGIELMLSLLFNVDEQELLKILIDKRDELVSLFRLIVNESYGVSDHVPEEAIVKPLED